MTSARMMPRASAGGSVSPASQRRHVRASLPVRNERLASVFVGHAKRARSPKLMRVPLIRRTFLSGFCVVFCGIFSPDWGRCQSCPSTLVVPAAEPPYTTRMTTPSLDTNSTISVEFENRLRNTVRYLGLSSNLEQLGQFVTNSCQQPESLLATRCRVCLCPRRFAQRGVQKIGGGWNGEWEC